MLERAYAGGRLDHGLGRAGVPFSVGTWSLQEGLRFPPELQQCGQFTAPNFVVYGSHQFCKAVQKETRFLGVGLYFGLTGRRMEYLTYVSEMPDVAWLNAPVMTSWAHLRANRSHWRNLMGGTGLFVRPNSGTKTFAGQTLTYQDWDHECRGLDATSSVMADTLVVVAPLQELQGEFRFVVADQQVVAGSEYRWDNQMDVRRDWPPECEAMAARVAARGSGWQPDSVYVVDVALTAEGPKVIELNSFCCAGMYSCCPDSVVRAVGAVALAETKDEA